MKLVLVAAILFLPLAVGARADVDTLECNTAMAIRVKYAAMATASLHDFQAGDRMGEFCLIRHDEPTPVAIGGQTLYMRYEGRPRNPDDAAVAVAALGFSEELVFTPDDLPGREFYFQRMIRMPYDPAADDNWRYSPLWMEYSDPIRIVVGEDERQGGI